LRSAAVRIQPGSRSSRISAVERNVSGSTRNVTAPISDSSWRVTSASELDSAARADPSSAARRISTTRPRTPPGKLAPTASAIATMTTDCTTITTALCATRPAISALRRTGETSSRSVTPRLISSIVAIPLQPDEKSADITTIPGAR
jgi:hypothetical protein